MISNLTQRLTLVGLLIVVSLGAGSARAQFEGLDLTETPAPAPKKGDKPAAKKSEPKKETPVAAPAPVSAEKSL